MSGRRRAIRELEDLLERCRSAESAIFTLEAADWGTAQEGAKYETLRLQAKRHGVSLVSGYIIERLGQLRAEKP
jgi:hypothetical protein